MDDKVKELIEELKGYNQQHIKLGQLMITAKSGNIYHTDLFAGMTLNRSLQLLVGFCILIENKNFIAAAPLIRLQLDNCLRFSAIFLVNDPNEFIKAVIKGTSINKQKDKSNEKMSDRYLVKKLAKIYPWISEVYEQTSGYIHLSEKHFFHAIQFDKEDNGDYFQISTIDRFLEDHHYIEALEAFKAITNILFELIMLWIHHKNPSIIRYPQKDAMI